MQSLSVAVWDDLKSPPAWSTKHCTWNDAAPEVIFVPLLAGQARMLGVEVAVADGLVEVVTVARVDDGDGVLETLLLVTTAEEVRTAPQTPLLVDAAVRVECM